MSNKKLSKMEDLKENLDFELDDTADIPMVEVPIETAVEKEIKKPIRRRESVKENEDKNLVNCLRNERITIRHIPKSSGIWGNNPRHVLSGGMAENATKTYVVPRLSSGVFVNVLTDSEKTYLEDVMGLEYNALSIYKKHDNFWDDSNENGIGKVTLYKRDNYLDLSVPEDYIRYKILLANKNYIAPSLQAMQDAPKVTYQYVIVSNSEETKIAKGNMSATMMCYKEFGKIENDFDTLKFLVEILDSRPIAINTRLEFLQTKVNDLIQSNSKMFLKAVTDPLLSTKVLIKKGVEAGVISTRGNYLYLKKDNTPLCEANEEPVLSVAAKYLNSPKHQDTLFYLQAKINQ